jgi:hypothetical protein
MTTPHYHHPAAYPDEALLNECTIGQSRSSGPGGQHRNKVQTQVTLTHRPSGIAATAGERRSQRENKSMALKRLRLKLAVELRTGVESGEIGSELLESRKAQPKRETPAATDPDAAFFASIGIKLRSARPGEMKKRLRINPKHRDYPALLAEVLDAIAAAGWEPKHAATRLDVSVSQLLKLIKQHPAALHKLNEERKTRGKHVFH